MTIQFRIPLTPGSRGAWPTSVNARFYQGDAQQGLTRDALAWHQTVKDYCWAELQQLSPAERAVFEQAELAITLDWYVTRGVWTLDTDNPVKSVQDAAMSAFDPQNRRSRIANDNRVGDVHSRRHWLQSGKQQCLVVTISVREKSEDAVA